jgi:16S rRNA (cytosine1402-N4)-methyltransferase
VEGNIQRDFYGSIFRPFQIITKKAIEPSAEELVRNSRARSAKMRVGERLAISDEHFEWG